MYLLVINIYCIRFAPPNLWVEVIAPMTLWPDFLRFSQTLLHELSALKKKTLLCAFFFYIERKCSFVMDTLRGFVLVNCKRFYTLKDVKQTYSSFFGVFVIKKDCILFLSYLDMCLVSEVSIIEGYSQGHVCSV